MTANQKISIVLLIGRIITVFIMAFVIKKQFNVLKAKNYPELNRLRHTLLLGSFIILLSNVLPIIIDTMGVFGKGSFNLLLAYVFSNNITAIMFAAILLYNIRLAERIKLIEKQYEDKGNGNKASDLLINERS